MIASRNRRQIALRRVAPSISTDVRAASLTNGKGPRANLNFNHQWIERMQTLVLSCVFGAVCTMVLGILGSAAAKRDRLMRRGDKLFRPEEI
jgi:hypothetical protein